MIRGSDILSGRRTNPGRDHIKHKRLGLASRF